MRATPIASSVEPTFPFSIQDGRYTVTAELGRGAHAIVYRAHDGQTGRDVAVKILRNDATDLDLATRFRREIEITAALAHPHIASVLASGEWEHHLFFVSELAEHASLDARLARDRQLGVDEAVGIAVDVLEALDFAHRRGVVHRDIKPENILLGHDGALVADFGIARAVGIAVEHALVTSTGIAVGTLLYMSPEQICAERIDGRSDQYSTALVLYEMLTGVRPHETATVEGLRALRIAGNQHPVRAHRPHVPEHVDRAVMRALSPAPADRFADCAAFAAALRDNGAAARTVVSSPTANVAGRTAASTPWSRTQRRRVVATATLVTISMLGAAWALLGGRTDDAAAADGATASRSPRAVAIVVSSEDASGAGRALSARLRAELATWDAIALVDTASDDYHRAVRSRRSDRADVLTFDASTRGDSATVVVRLLRAGAREPEVFPPVAFLSSDGAPQQAIRLLAMRVVGGAGATPDSSPGLETLRRPDAAALRAYVRGWAALRAGQFDSATTAFQAAAASAPDFATAQFRAAQTQAWDVRAPVATWRGDAQRALRTAGALGDVDSLNAEALVALAEEDHPRACEMYRAAIARDAGNFTSLFGLGECLRRDKVALRDGASPTGYRFRSNHLDALRAYTAALDAIPSPRMGELFARVTGLTYATTQKAREGATDTRPPKSVMALPALDGDSVVLRPMLMADFISTSEVPATYMQAVRKERAQFREFAANWVRRADESFAAQVGWALAQELDGMWQPTARSDDRSAIAALERAMMLAASANDSVTVLVAEVRVHLRRGDFGSASRVASRALELFPQAEPALASRLAPLAALLGRSTELASLSTVSVSTVGARNQLPPWLASRYGEAMAAAATQACELLPARFALLDSGLVNSFAEVELAKARETWAQPVARLGISCDVRWMHEFLPASVPFNRAVRSFAAGRSAAVRAIMDTVQSGRSGATASAVAWDTEFAEAWLLVQIGDSSGAYARLSASLDDLAGMSERTLTHVSSAAGLRNGLRLSQRLAAARGDKAKAELWGRWVRELDGR